MPFTLYVHRCETAGMKEPVEKFLARYDPGAYRGRGLVTFTDDIRAALQFRTMEDAALFYYDNAPLRAYTATVMNTEDSPLAPNVVNRIADAVIAGRSAGGHEPGPE